MTRNMKSATIIPIENENIENAENDTTIGKYGNPIDTTLTPENTENKKRPKCRPSSATSFFGKFPFPSAQGAAEVLEEASSGEACCGTSFFIVILCWLAFLLCTVRVDAGHVGIKKRFGAVADEALEEGLSFIMPFVDSVYHMDTRIRNADQDTTRSFFKSVRLRGQLTEFLVKKVILGHFLVKIGHLGSLFVTLEIFLHNPFVQPTVWTYKPFKSEPHSNTTSTTQTR